MTNRLNEILARRRSVLWLMLLLEAIFLFAWHTGALKGPHSGLLALPPTIIVGSLFSTQGSPKNWWAAYWGTTITIDPDKYRSSQDPKLLVEEIAEWLKTSNIKPVYKVNAFRYTFLRKKHAAMFKLAWG